VRILLIHSKKKYLKYARSNNIDYFPTVYKKKKGALLLILYLKNRQRFDGILAAKCQSFLIEEDCIAILRLII